MLRYAVVQGCPVPRRLAPFLTRLLAESGASLQSCYRGTDAEPLLARLGKKSQQQLWDGWRNHLPGYLPANPPGYSTHELRNDGQAYPRIRRGDKLPWWAVGLDLDDAHVDRFVTAAARHGWKVNRTYPLSLAEGHHVNFRQPPLWHRVRAAVGLL